jgi:isoquinoline 1-oxidoreductase beta subunit
MTRMQISRRTFITTAIAAGGGMALGFHIPSRAMAEAVSGRPWMDESGATEVNAWLTIDTDGIVTVRCPHTEMGQGGMTSVSQLVAEELNVPWESVRCVLADANRHVTQGEVYVNMSTGGSNLVRNRHPHIMQAGASARERLKEAAAQAWGVSRADVTAEQGVLTSGSNRGTYGEFATAAAGITLDEEPAIKAYGDWWLLGTDVPRMDVAPKSMGKAIYPIDVRVEGMVYAAVRACPVPGGVLSSFDASAVMNRPGVIAVVQLDQKADRLANADLRSAVAVVADTWYRAKTALDLLPIEWDFKGNDQYSFRQMDEQARQLMTEEAQHAEEVRGDPRPILASSGSVISGEYMRPYESHVPMSPPAAVVDIKADRVDVWSFTQNVAATLLLVADQLGRNPAEVFVHGTYQGGAFGNGNAVDVARQAAEIAKQVDRPVKVIWSREDDIAQCRSCPPVWGHYEAALGADGLPEALLIRAVGEVKNPAYADRGHVNAPYLVPNFRYERHVVPTNIPVGPNRAPGNNANAFMMEQFIDEMALAGGWDPLDWRIKMTEGNEPWQRVLLKMKEVSGFTTDLPRGVGMGIGVVESHGSVVGVTATVEVSRRGALYIDKVQVVSNSGYVINPRAANEQVFSCVAWALSHCLYGALDFRDGRIQNLNFDNYRILRYRDMPDIESVFAMSEDNWWGGFGETATPPTPPAIANAIYFATGRRVRSTPILRQDLSWA